MCSINGSLLPFFMKILGARHLTKTGRGIPSPFVEVEIVGSKFDAKHNTFKTSTKGKLSSIFQAKVFFAEHYKIEASEYMLYRDATVSGLTENLLLLKASQSLLLSKVSLNLLLFMLTS